MPHRESDPYRALTMLDHWPVDNAAAAVVTADGRIVAARGDLGRSFPLASVTKPLFTYALLVALEEGSLHLHQPAGPSGSTVRHLLAHASGLGPDGQVLAAPETRRIYSNAGFDALDHALSTSTGLSAATYLGEAVLEPLGMGSTRLDGSVAHAATSTVADLIVLVREWFTPTLVHPSTLANATVAHFPELVGVLPGFGRQAPNPWGLGFEIRGNKSPHWTGTTNSPETFGHFGQSGTFVWTDPVKGVAMVALTDHPFGQWAADLWPRASDHVLAALFA